MPCVDILNFYCTAIRPVLEYCAPLCHQALPQYLSEDIERVQKRVLSIIKPHMSYSDCLAKFGFITLHARPVALCDKLFDSIKSCPGHKLFLLLPPRINLKYNLRCPRTFAMPRCNTNHCKNTFIPSMCT